MSVGKPAGRRVQVDQRIAGMNRQSSVGQKRVRPANRFVSIADGDRCFPRGLVNRPGAQLPVVRARQDDGARTVQGGGQDADAAGPSPRYRDRFHIPNGQYVRPGIAIVGRPVAGPNGQHPAAVSRPLEHGRPDRPVDVRDRIRGLARFHIPSLHPGPDSQKSLPVRRERDQPTRVSPLVLRLSRRHVPNRDFTAVRKCDAGAVRRKID